MAEIILDLKSKETRWDIVAYLDNYFSEIEHEELSDNRLRLDLKGNSLLEVMDTMERDMLSLKEVLEEMKELTGET